MATKAPFKIVPISSPVSLNNTTPTADIIDMKLYDKVIFAVMIGVMGAADATLALESCTSAAGAGNAAQAFNYRTSGALPSDTFSDSTSSGTDGSITLANAGDAYDGKTILVEVDAADLPDASPFLKLIFTAGAAATLESCVAILYGARYAPDVTAIV